MLLEYQRCGESQGLFVDFFHPYARLDPMERNLARPTNAVGEGERADSQRSKGAGGLVEGSELHDLAAGVVFSFHAYTLPQPRKKARDFFIFFETFFLDNHPPIFEKNSYERLRFRSLGPIFKTLQPINLSLFYLSEYP